MKKVLLLIMLIGLTFTTSVRASSDVITKKATKDTTDIFKVYDLLSKQAPEIFLSKTTSTKIIIYGKHKQRAYDYLTKYKNGKNIYINKKCNKDKKLVVLVCKAKKNKNNLARNNTNKELISKPEDITFKYKSFNRISHR